MIKGLYLEVLSTLHRDYQRCSLCSLEAMDLHRYPSVAAGAYTPEENKWCFSWYSSTKCNLFRRRVVRGPAASAASRTLRAKHILYYCTYLMYCTYSVNSSRLTHLHVFFRLGLKSIVHEWAALTLPKRATPSASSKDYCVPDWFQKSLCTWLIPEYARKNARNFDNMVIWQ